MRVNRVIIKESGILKNIDQELSPVTLIIGDNERGKTQLLQWISRSLFEKPGKTETGEMWTDKIGGMESNQFSVQSFYPYFDSQRMKNLLFVQETDLLFKYKNPEDVAKHNYWNREITTLLYGNDTLSDTLKKNIDRALGVASVAKVAWLDRFHEYLYNFKNTLDDLVPSIEKISSKEYGLYQLNDSLGSIDQKEKEILSKEEVYFLMDRVKVGEDYLNAYEAWDNYRKKETEFQKVQDFIDTGNEQLQDFSDDLFEIDSQINHKEQELAEFHAYEKEIINDPQKVIKQGFSGQVLQMFFGLFLTCSGVFIAFQTRNIAELNMTKLFSLLSFVAGAMTLLSSYFKLLFLQNAPNLSSNPIYKNHLKKATASVKNSSRDLENLHYNKNKIREDIAFLKKEIKSAQFHNDDLRHFLRINHRLQNSFQDISYKVMELFGTTDLQEIEVECEFLTSQIKGQTPDFHYDELKNIRVQKDQLIEQKTQSSSEYERTKGHIFGTVKSWLEDLRVLPMQEMVTHFYPELYHIELKDTDSLFFTDLIDIVEKLSDRVSKDRYRAEKLANFYQHIETNSLTLLSKAVHSHHFQHLIQNVFGGKYRAFRVDLDNHKHLSISAETYQGEFIPLDEMSSSGFAQFWLCLRLVVAKSILGKEDGVILLDDPFTTFDPIRKQTFVDLLNAFAHEGWQIICTVTDDPTLVKYFKTMFGDALKIIDLNKDYQADEY